MKFTDCYVGWPGSVHDNRVFKNSDLFERVEQDEVTMCPNGSFIVGDAAYQLMTWVMTPFKDNGKVTREQKTYNYIQSSTRTVIERAFGLLKGRFPRLRYLDMSNLEDMCKMIIAICTIHNFILDQDDGLEFDNIEIVPEEEVNNFTCMSYSNGHAQRKRDDIVKLLNNMEL